MIVRLAPSFQLPRAGAALGANLLSCRSLTVRVPITIVHPSSLDLPPHAVEPVRRALEPTQARYYRSPPPAKAWPHDEEVPPRVDSVLDDCRRPCRPGGGIPTLWHPNGTVLDVVNPDPIGRSHVAPQLHHPPPPAPMPPSPPASSPTFPIPPPSQLSPFARSPAARSSPASAFQPSPLLPERIHREAPQTRAADLWDAATGPGAHLFRPVEWWRGGDRQGGRAAHPSKASRLHVPKTRDRCAPPQPGLDVLNEGPGTPNSRLNIDAHATTSPFDGYPPAILDAYATASDLSPAACSWRTTDESPRTLQPRGARDDAGPFSPTPPPRHRTPAPQTPLSYGFVRSPRPPAPAPAPHARPVVSEDVIASLTRELEASPRRRPWTQRRSGLRGLAEHHRSGFDGVADAEAGASDTEPSGEDESSPLLRRVQGTKSRPRSSARSVFKRSAILCPMPQRRRPLSRVSSKHGMPWDDQPMSAPRSSWDWQWSSDDGAQGEEGKACNAAIAEHRHDAVEAGLPRSAPSWPVADKRREPSQLTVLVTPMANPRVEDVVAAREGSAAENPQMQHSPPWRYIAHSASTTGPPVSPAAPSFGMYEGFSMGEPGPDVGVCSPGLPQETAPGLAVTDDAGQQGARPALASDRSVEPATLLPSPARPDASARTLTAATKRARRTAIMIPRARERVGASLKRAESERSPTLIRRRKRASQRGSRGAPRTVGALPSGVRAIHRP